MKHLRPRAPLEPILWNCDMINAVLRAAIHCGPRMIVSNVTLRCSWETQFPCMRRFFEENRA